MFYEETLKETNLFLSMFEYYFLKNCKIIQKTLFKLISSKLVGIQKLLLSWC